MASCCADADSFRSLAASTIGSYALLDLLAKFRDQKVSDVLDDGAIGSIDDEGHAELTAQVGVEVTGWNLLGHAHEVLRAGHAVHVGASERHATDGFRVKVQPA